MLRPLNSFKCAFKGIIYCLKNERHMRIHVCVAVYVLVLSAFFCLSAFEYAILILTISSVIVAEMINTVAEGLSDLSAADYNITAKISKDIAAGAVLLSAAFSVAIGFLLFLKKEPFIKMFYYFKEHIFIFILFLFSVFFATLYIGFGSNELKNKCKSVNLKVKRLIKRGK